MRENCHVAAATAPAYERKNEEGPNHPARTPSGSVGGVGDTMLCVGRPGGRLPNIYLYYDVMLSFDSKRSGPMDKTGVCRVHSSFVSHLDWSTAGDMIVSNSGDYEVARQIQHAAGCRLCRAWSRSVGQAALTALFNNMIILASTAYSRVLRCAGL